MEVVLFEPDIPQNAGNVARTCAVTGSSLTLVEPLGFRLSDRKLKRSGLDYWADLPFKTILDLPEYLKSERRPFFLFSSKGKRLYTEPDYPEEALLVFGSETRGLPPDLLESELDHVYTLPMIAGQRCLNLANTVAIVLYEAWRKKRFINASLSMTNAMNPAD